MKEKKFDGYGMFEQHPDYQKAIKRCANIYQRRYDLRSEFARDYTRIIFSQAYRRLKHKTQVFFAVEDDHVCTRSEHVNLVESISYTIAHQLGLNTELTKAIAVGHDLGHAPFGHGGETILTQIAQSHQLDRFWHEKNSLHFVDHIELLEDNQHNQYNLNLTYAVRDGIISHCGEMNQKNIIKREEYIDLNNYTKAGLYNPYTWEGCVVKMSDKIAYLARDIEDALRLKVLKQTKVDKLKLLINNVCKEYKFTAINNGTIVNYFIQDVCKNSNLSDGIALSDEAHEIMKIIMKFNYENIYLIDRLKIHANYVKLILNSIFDFLLKYDKLAKEKNTNIIDELLKDRDNYPQIIDSFICWLEKYSKITGMKRPEIYQNKIIYDFTKDDKAIIRCIIDYLSGMSDEYIIKIFNELISF